MLKKLIRNFKYMLLKLFRIKDSAHSIAMGFTVGASINFVPSFGAGVLISIYSAKLFRGNAIAGFLGGVSLMMFFPFLLYLNMKTGEFIFPVDIQETLEVIVGEDNALEDTVGMGVTFGRTFIAGMLINMVIFIMLVYVPIYHIFKRYQKTILKYLYSNWVKN